MPEFRRDPLSDHWVIVAPERANRPEQFAGDGAGIPSRCPFCAGHEADTPPAVAAFPADGEPAPEAAWQVRVIPNKYPAVVRTDRPVESHGEFFELRNGFGVHEVIIESPDHVLSPSALSDQQFGLVFHAYQERVQRLSQDRRLAYAQVFKNCGAAAGASLEHTHSQLIATPVVPTQVERELSLARRHFQQTGRCAFCDMLAEELAIGSRIVIETPEFVAFCPFASQFPFEVWVVPRRHQSNFENEETGKLGGLASLTREIVLRIERTLGRPAFNYLIHTAPFDTPGLEHYHWHLEFSPRLVKTAGFEWGAGDYINTVSPEDAARVLRSGH